MARGKKKKDDIPPDRQCFRHWVELRDLRDGTVRELPVKVFQKILLATKKNAAPPKEPLGNQHRGSGYRPSLEGFGR